MKTFQFHITPSRREEVLYVLRQSNDVIIDSIDSTSDTIAFTIQLDDEAADLLFEDLKQAVDLKIVL